MAIAKNTHKALLERFIRFTNTAPLRGVIKRAVKKKKKQNHKEV